MAKGMDRAVGAGSAANRAVLNPHYPRSTPTAPRILFRDTSSSLLADAPFASPSSGFLVWRKNLSQERSGDRE
jgi:hypothetical protein